ncbi:DUF4214 domain-containing protein [Undibacterium sp. TJN19]|uniref:DUF4214 domain-containing protein n=1 Tax=Undibacterium sp. TJN19 TaxID=3413055 RepID=UPI003BF28211
MGINASTIQKLYIAYFNRPADVAGLQYWEGQLDANKISLPSLAQSFSEQVEYKNTYAGKNTADVITALYKNLFARNPDADGLKYWVGQIDAGSVNMGTAALAILNGATPQSQDGKTIDLKLSFASNFTASLDTDAKIASYTSASSFESMRGALAAINANAALGPVNLTRAVTIAEAANGINAAEKMAGMDVLVDLTGVAVQAGYRIELMNGNASFATPVVYTLNVTDVLNQKASVRIPAGADWGADGGKTIGVKISDLNGNTGKIGGQLSVQLDTTPPVAPVSVGLDVAYMHTTPGSAGYDAVTEVLHVRLADGQTATGKASLQLGGVTISTLDLGNLNGTSLDFSFDTATGKRVYDGFKTDKNLSLVIADQAGNFVQSNLSQITSTISHKPVDAARNISIVPVGGTLSNNALNSSNTNLMVDAEVNAKTALNNAELLLNGQVIARATADQIVDGKIHFDLHSSSNAGLQSLVTGSGFLSVRVWDYFGESAISEGNPILNVSYTGIAGGGTTSSGSGNTNSTLNAPANIKITAVGGTTGNNTLNASNTDLIVDASIIAGQATGGKAELKIGGKLIAVDTAINAAKNSLHFDLGTGSAQALQSIVNAGGVVTVVLTNAMGQAISSTDNPTLIVDYTPQAIATPMSIAAATDGINAQEVASVIDVQIDLSGLQNAQDYSIELLKDGSSFSTPVKRVITGAEAAAHSAILSIPAGSAWGSDGSKALSLKLSNSITGISNITASSNVIVDTTPPAPASLVTYVSQVVRNGIYEVELTIPAGQMTGGKAVLKGSTTTYTDSSISATDTKVTFTVPESVLASATFNGGMDFFLYDAAGNVTPGNIYRLPQNYMTVGSTPLNAPTNIKYFPIGGNVVADTINASNTSLRVTADITPGQAVGGHAELTLAGGRNYVSVVDKQILAGDTTVTFEITTDSPFALKSLLAGTATLTPYLYLYDANNNTIQGASIPLLKTAYIDGEAIVGGLSAPTSIKLTPIGGTITPVQGNVITLNGSNVGFTIDIGIVPGQITNGKAELWIGNKLVLTSYTPVGVSDSTVGMASWSIPQNALTPGYLQSVLPSGGDLVIKLYDQVGHMVSSTPGSLNVVTNYASQTGYASPDGGVSLNHIGIIGQSVPMHHAMDLMIA